MKQSKHGTFAILPLCIVAFIPLVMMGHTIETKLGHLKWYTDEVVTDYFLFFKMCAIVLAAILMLINIVVKIWKGEKVPKFERRDWVQWGTIAGYIVLSIVSTIMSKYSYFGYHGIVDQFEPIWVVIGYGIIAYYAFTVMQDKKVERIVLRCITIGATIEGLIAALQAVGLDVMRTDFATNMMSMLSEGKMGIGIEKGISYGTLYNPNYMGVFCVMMLPLVMVNLISEKKKIWKIISGITEGLLMISLFGSGSKTGMVIFVIQILCVTFFQRKYLLSNKGALIASCIVLLILVGGVVWKGSSVVNAIKGSIKNEFRPVVSDIKTTKDGIYIKVYDYQTIIRFNENAASQYDAMIITDASGNNIEMVDRHSEVGCYLECGIYLFARVVELEDGRYGTVISINGKDYVFAKTEKGYKFCLKEGVYVSLPGKKVETVKWMDEHSHFASGRGYIWSRTLPLLTKTMFIGSGRDSFTLVYPNTDYIGKIRANQWGMIVTRPHNMYLQIAVEDGCLALVLFLAAIILAITGKVGKQDDGFGLSATLMKVSVIGYLLMGMTNDSFIGVTAVFWLVIGYLFAIEKKEKLA